MRAGRSNGTLIRGSKIKLFPDLQRFFEQSSKAHLSLMRKPNKSKNTCIVYTIFIDVSRIDNRSQESISQLFMAKRTSWWIMGMRWSTNYKGEKGQQNGKTSTTPKICRRDVGWISPVAKELTREFFIWVWCKRGRGRRSKGQDNKWWLVQNRYGLWWENGFWVVQKIGWRSF